MNFFFYLLLFTLKVLKDLFRRLSSDSPSQELRVSQVFAALPGHIFVAVSLKKGISPKGVYMP